MTDSKITKKLHPLNRLTTRILFVAILVLVIPFLLQSIYLYIEEYEQKYIDIQSNLEILAKERARFIDQQLNSSSLELIPLDVLTEDLSVDVPLRVAILDASGNVLEENMQRRAKSSFLEINQQIGQKKLFLQFTIPTSYIKELQIKNYFYRLILFVGFMLVFGGGGLYLLLRRVNRPLKNLIDVLDRVSKGDQKARYTPDKMGFEINDIAIAFNQTLDAEQKFFLEAQNERIEKEKLSQELKIGHDIQLSLFPKSLVHEKSIKIFAKFEPAKDVNGDFYDFIKLKNDKILIVICDMVGKGIPACLYSLGLRGIIRSFASVYENLSCLIQQVNDQFWTDAHEETIFATAWISVLDLKTKELEFCSLGHLPALLKTDGKIQELNTDVMALGVSKFEKISTKKIQLKKNDTLLLYTDGAIECENPQMVCFGKDRLVSFLKNYESPWMDFNDNLLKTLKSFSENIPYRDDVTFVTVWAKE